MNSHVNHANILFKLLQQSWQYLRAFTLIFICLALGNLVSQLLPIAIPGSILGMLLLFFLLATQFVKVSWVQPGCQLLIKYMTILFVPISVGIMNYYQLLLEQFGAIIVSNIISTVITLLVVGIGAEWLFSRPSHDETH